ncbi:MAG: cytosolic protein [Coleofasciculaceae cyanobacterium SM2_1_6]|nr:cytosolic protein [Coleofasciculaceae cyanobacterium SM2_1_6]
MSNPQTEFDSPWKEILENYFEDFVQFFLPVASTEIDWNRPPEFLDKELQQVVRDAELGRRLADKLVKVWRSNGEETWVLIHVEVQSQDEADFAERMFVYHYRIFDKYRRKVVSLAVLGDERRNWKPAQFGYQLWETKTDFNFKVVKLLDYYDRWSELEASPNPFAIVVVAHLKAQETRSNRLERKRWKLILIRRLYEQNYSRTEVINLFHFIDWVMSLSEELEQEFWQSVQQLEEERSMPYITSVERIGLQKGRQEGRQEGLLKGIELGLKLKFGAEGLAVLSVVLSEVGEIKDVGLLESILSGLETANTLGEWRKLYQPRLE